MASMKIKVILGQDIRLWRYSQSECSLSSLREFVSSPASFGLSNFWLQWEDDEGDRITLHEEQDFKGALTCAHEESRKSLKIYVNNEGQQQHSVPNSPNSPNGVANGSKSAKGAENESEKEDILKEMALDFLQNPEIISCLPDLHRLLFESIQNCKDCTDSQSPSDLIWDSPQNIEQILRSLLESDSFSPITSHPLFIRKLEPMIPVMCQKMSTHLSVLMHYRDAIALWIPHLASVLGRNLSNFNEMGAFSGAFDNSEASFSGDFCGFGGFSQFFPLMCSFMTNCNVNGNGNVAGNCNGNTDSEQVVHFGVTCDGCNVSPIKGIRYKCTVCGNFDLCGACESVREEKGCDAAHPMIKFVKPQFGRGRRCGNNENLRRDRRTERSQCWNGNGVNGQNGRWQGPPGMQFAPWNQDGGQH